MRKVARRAWPWSCHNLQINSMKTSNLYVTHLPDRETGNDETAAVDFTMHRCQFPTSHRVTSSRQGSVVEVCVRFFSTVLIRDAILTEIQCGPTTQPQAQPTYNQNQLQVETEMQAVQRLQH